MPLPFPDAVKWYADTVAPQLGNPSAIEYLEDPARSQEAGLVDPCVQRFADYEISPPPGKGVGRGRRVVVKPLAHEIEKSFAALDDAKREDVRDAVVRVIAIGYATLAVPLARKGLTPSLDELDPGTLWERWSVRQGTAIKTFKEAGMKDVDAALTPVASVQLQAELEKAGAYSLRYKGGIGQLGIFYARAGELLRLFQCTADFDLEPHKSQLEEQRSWQF